MDKQKLCCIAAFLILTLVIYRATAPVLSQSGIMVSGADQMRYEGIISSPSLSALVNNILTRMLVQNTDHIRYVTMQGTPAELQTKIVSIAMRTTVEHADLMRSVSLAQLPVGLQSISDSIGLRITFMNLDANRPISMNYPGEVLQDKTPPVVSDVMPNSSGNATKLAWNTDEFTRCKLRFGPQAETMTTVLDEVLYAKLHEVSIAALSEGTYLAEASCIDQSGNQTVSLSSFTVMIQRFMYLPLVRK